MIVVPVRLAIVGFACRGIRDLFQFLHLFLDLNLSFLGLVMIDRVVSSIGMAGFLTPSRVPSVVVSTVTVPHGAQHVGQPDHRNPQYQQGGRAG